MTEENQTAEPNKPDNPNKPPDHDTGPPFFVNVEGELHPWQTKTITTEQIAALGGFDSAQGVIVIDAHNNERTLAPGETVELKPGMGFAKKVKFKRGRDRIEQELELVRAVVPGLQLHGKDWGLLPGQKLPEKWAPSTCDIAFQIPNGYPGAQPYGIFVPATITFNGTAPRKFTASAPQCPFPGKWGLLSWQPESWKPGATPTSGTNLVNWILSFAKRFQEGA